MTLNDHVNPALLADELIMPDLYQPMDHYPSAAFTCWVLFQEMASVVLPYLDLALCRKANRV